MEPISSCIASSRSTFNEIAKLRTSVHKFALHNDIDYYQFKFFLEVIQEKVKENDYVIVMTNEPNWILDWYWDETHLKLPVSSDTPFFRSAANEHATSGSSLTGDSIHVVTSVLRHRKRTRKDVRPMLAQFENLPLKRTQGSTGTGEVDSNPELRVGVGKVATLLTMQSPKVGSHAVSYLLFEDLKVQLVWDVLLFPRKSCHDLPNSSALMEYIMVHSLVTTKDVGDAVTLLQSLVGLTFDSQLVLPLAWVIRMSMRRDYRN
ncbi:hypothetical protein Tco_1554819 [Tanacetum coccineum]